MGGNLGSTAIKRRHRQGGPMDAFDKLPAPLRNWLSTAALPWSPKSAHRIWSKARSKGLSVEDALSTLAAAEAQTLTRERQAQTLRPAPSH